MADEDEDRGDAVVVEDIEQENAEPKAEVDPEVKPELEPEVKPAVETPEYQIPKSRFDAKNAQLRAAQARIAELEAAVEDKEPEPELAAPTTFDEQIGAIDKKYAQAVADGEAEKAAALMRDARTLERQRYEDLMTQATQGVADRTSEDVRYDRVVDTLEDNYPFLNPDDESFAEDIANDIRDLTEAYVAGGKYSASDALVVAADMILSQHGVSEQGTKPRGTNTAKNADAASRQPPDTDGIGKNSDAAGPTSANPDPGKLSDDEFDKLPDETRARLRGDVL